MNSLTGQNSTPLEHLTNIIRALPFGIVTFSDLGEINLINADAIELLELGDTTPEENIDTDYRNFFKGFPDVIDKIERLTIKKRTPILEIVTSSSKGTHLSVTCFSMLKGFMVLLSKIKAEQLTSYVTFNDSLTQLTNRKRFEVSFSEFLESYKEKDSLAALVVFDIDNFRVINDSFGHSLGDETLKITANILKSRVKTDSLVARIGDDKFVILLSSTSAGYAYSFADSIRKLMYNSVFHHGGHDVKVTLSAGVTLFSTLAGTNPSKLLSIAETACQISKEQGKNKVCLINEECGEFEEYIEGIKWFDSINEAIQNERFVLYAQEISPLAAKSNAGSYYEILLRLNDENGSVIGPNRFVPIAERYHMMPELDRYVLTLLLKNMHKFNGVNFAVNLSGQTISDPSFVTFVSSIREKYLFDPKDITFEITETAAVRDFQGTIEVMTALIDMGFRFSLDDFGTGLSSFTYLKELPIKKIKIDGSFVKDIDRNEVSLQMVKSIHNIGKVMGLETVAEFVESKEVYKILQEIGVHYVQGYLVHKPAPLESIVSASQMTA